MGFPIMPRVTVACIGDSLTSGQGNGTCQTYPKELQQLLAQKQPSCTWDVKNLGVEGSSAKDWLYWLGAGQATSYARFCTPPDVKGVLAAGCDVIIVMLGTNDAQKGFWNEQEVTSSLTQLANKLKSDCPRASLVLATPPPIVPSGSFAVGFEPDAINRVFPRVIPQIAASVGAVCVDCFSAVPTSALRPDGVHLDSAGYRGVASAMLDAVLRGSQGGVGAASAPPPQAPQIASGQAAGQLNAQPPVIQRTSSQYPTVMPAQVDPAPYYAAPGGSLALPMPGMTASPNQITASPGYAPPFPNRVTNQSYGQPMPPPSSAQPVGYLGFPGAAGLSGSLQPMGYPSAVNDGFGNPAPIVGGRSLEPRVLGGGLTSLKPSAGIYAM
jgi:lysophospholipase L1-like esterase